MDPNVWPTDIRVFPSANTQGGDCQRALDQFNPIGLTSYQGNRILIDFILAPNHHPEPVEGLSRLVVAWGDEMDKNGPTLAYYVYMLRCSDGSYYVGHTNDLEHRLAAHERGAIKGYTLSRRLVELVFSDQFSTRLEAFHRERKIKGWSRAGKEALIKGDWDGLVELSNRSSGGAPSTGSG